MMFTREEICTTIGEIRMQPMTPSRIQIMAYLLYIKRHLVSTEEGMSGVHLTKEIAMEWTRNMKNADGTTGPHWTMEKTEEARTQHGVNCDPLAFWVAMNMIYSDYSKAAEKADANKMEFYVCMAKAFLEDKDSRNQGGEKLAKYYEYVVL